MRLTGKRFIIILSVLSLHLVLSNGCFKNYEVYDFKPVEKDFGWGKVGAKLIGSEEIKGNTIIKQTPYDLLIWFGSNNVLKGYVKIRELKLVCLKTNKTILTKKNLPEEDIIKVTSSYRAYFSFDDIDLNYSSISLSIIFSLKQDDKVIEGNVDFLFEPEYKTFKRIDGV